MSSRIIIVGAGGFGREVHAWAGHAIASGLLPAGVTGFLDDRSDPLDGYGLEDKLLGRCSDYLPEAGDLFLCAIGDPKAKLQVSSGLRSRGAEFVSLIHPTAIIGPRCRLGVGCVVCPYATVTADVTIGDFVCLNAHATVGHDASLGDGCTLSGHCDITGGARLGEGVFMGSHAAVLPGVRVGDYATIAAGSVAYHRVAPETTAIGVPAKRLAEPTA
ncbi:putative acetyltransferase EpsM [Posidoniimonas polymericola]|uniref:Putative acetyltransferase EpsM n=1 Tax=Posidoniimonas polymericola TaxID=2528002 RepID=A0A5C5YSC5_9BACT|nr:acetyltransferase [Posidoniimonas polymericola]TWT77776.1 putative acetyltransferase EpsM [Posidoniimonas polymericola]